MSQRFDIAALKASLEAFTDCTRKSEFNRTNLLSLLEILEHHIGTALDTSLPSTPQRGSVGLMRSDRTYLDGSTELLLQHPAVTLLSKLRKALGDLENGKTDEIFKAYKHGPNATLKWSDRDFDDSLKVVVRWIKNTRPTWTQRRIAVEISRNLKKTGVTRRGKELDADLVYNIIKRF